MASHGVSLEAVRVDSAKKLRMLRRLLESPIDFRPGLRECAKAVSEPLDGSSTWSDTTNETIGAAGTIGGVSGVVSPNGQNNRSPRLELVGHTTLGARDGANTHGAASEYHDLAAVGSFIFGNNELRLVDISDRTNPELVSTIGTDPEGHSSDIRYVDVHPTKPWVFTANEGGEDAGFAIVDASDRENPVLHGPFTVELAGRR